jgi:hypothetical protein
MVCSHVPEKGHSVLSGVKGQLGHERGRKSLTAGGIQTHPCGNRQSCLNPRIGSALCTLRRVALDSAGSLSGLKKFPFHFQEKPFYQQKEKAAREFCF